MMLCVRELRVRHVIVDMNDSPFEGDTPGDTPPPGADGIALEEFPIPR